LLLANTGDLQNRWQTTVQQLISMAHSNDTRRKVVAVVALGTSTTDTVAAVQQLSNQQIPVVGAITTSRKFDRIANMLKVPPDPSTLINTLRDYLHAHDQPPATAVVVEDRNTAGTDPYVDELKDAFHTTLEDWIGPNNDGQFVAASTPGSNAMSGMFHKTVSDICLSPTIDTILFAGRGMDMEEFVKALRERDCKNRKLTVMTGATALPSVEGQALREAGVQVVYAGLTRPEWLQGQGFPPRGWPDYTATLTSPDFQKIVKNLTDTTGYTCVAHDAVLIADRAIHLAVRARADPSAIDHLPTASDVTTQLQSIHDTAVVYGCSGDLEYTPTSGGIPKTPHIQIVTLSAP
jgi:ABC-type branched-subunit amino acid transport system substrate-binding protein